MCDWYLKNRVAITLSINSLKPFVCTALPDMRSPLADGYPPVPYLYPPMADRKLMETKKGLSLTESPFSETVTRMGLEPMTPTLKVLCSTC